jgi:hypothetical protein
MKQAFLFVATCLAFIACNQHQPTTQSTAKNATPPAKKQTEDSITIVNVTPRGTSSQTISMKDMKAELDEFQKITNENFVKGVHVYDPKTAQVWYVRHRWTKPAFAYFPKQWIGIGYHPQCLLGVEKNNAMYTLCYKDSVGEIMFSLHDVTQNIAETDLWDPKDPELYGSLRSALASITNLDEKEKLFSDKVFPQIIGEMKKMKLFTDYTKLSPQEIHSTLTRYYEAKKAQTTPKEETHTM